MARKAKKKDDFIDDGRVIADMNVDGMPWYKPKRMQKQQREMEDLHVTRKERIAMIKAAYKVALPYCLLLLAMFTLAFLLVMLWLK